MPTVRELYDRFIERQEVSGETDLVTQTGRFVNSVATSPARTVPEFDDTDWVIAPAVFVQRSLLTSSLDGLVERDPQVSDIRGAELLFRGYIQNGKNIILPETFFRGRSPEELAHIDMRMALFAIEFGKFVTDQTGLSKSFASNLGEDILRDDAACRAIVESMQRVGGSYTAEIVEGVEASDVVVENIKMMARAGVRIVLDDFFDGSFPMLERLNGYVKTVKISGTDTISLGINGTQNKVRALLHSAVGLGVTSVIWEGVNTGVGMQVVMRAKEASSGIRALRDVSFQGVCLG